MIVNIDARLENADWIKSVGLRTLAGEAVGHAFHGNQWTGGNGRAQRDTIKDIVEKAGLTFITAKELPENARQQLHINSRDDGSNALDSHVTEARGVVDALNGLSGGKGFEELRGMLKSKLKVGLVGYEPRQAAASMVTGDGNYVLLINTNYDARQSFKNPELKPLAFAGFESRRVIDASGTVEQAIAAQAKFIALHEFGHAYDKMKRGLSTDMLVADLQRKVPDHKLSDWLKKNISPYAATSAKDATAEAFSMLAGGKKLPKELEEWGRYVRG